MMADIDLDLNEIYPSTIIKVEQELDTVRVILTKDHPEASKLIAYYSPYCEEYRFTFEEGKRSVSLDVEEAETVLITFVQAILNPKVRSLIDQGILAMKASDIPSGINQKVL